METKQELVAYFSAEEAPGQKRRQLTVPEQHWAVVQNRDGVQVLAPGLHTLLSAWDTFLGRFVPPVWLMPQGALTMQPVVANLLSFDQQMMEADMLIQARIFDPLRLWQELVTGQVSLERQQVERELSRRLQPVLSKHLRQYLPDALQHQAQPAEEILRAITPSLRALLESWGLELLAVTHLGVRPALEVTEIQRQRQAIEQRLADLRLQGQIDEMERDVILQQARDDMGLGLSDADQVRIQMLSEERNALEALIQVLQERLERLESSVSERLDALAGVAAGQPPGPGSPTGQPSPASAPPAQPPVAGVASGPPPRPGGPAAQAFNLKAKRLEDWGSILRLLSTALALLTASTLLFFPQIFPDRRGLDFATAGVGFLAALFALLASMIARRESQRYRERAEVQVVEDLHASTRQAHIEQEQGVRRYLEQRLRQVSSNCDQAWRRVYEHDLDLVDLATTLRKHCSDAYGRLADQVQAADYRTSRFLSQSKTSLDDLAQMLALSQDVLGQAQQMVELSQDVYNAASASSPDLAAVQRGYEQLDQGRMAIANRFAQREQFLLR
jgi:hypothetical protein